TRLLEAGVEIETVRSIAGHVSARMTEYYSHVRAQTKYAALMRIEMGQSVAAKVAPRREIVAVEKKLKKTLTA
ncbi:MAG: hypothetical protein ACP5E2_17095, partial [Terracidiphilus sp.]